MASHVLANCVTITRAQSPANYEPDRRLHHFKTASASVAWVSKSVAVFGQFNPPVQFVSEIGILHNAHVAGAIADLDG
ncbi:hypothetical protein SAMN04488135_109189 [Pollutimonas bauzanensis]|uniref:Uncharacterized protein n=1 Tax=Pollutimonas bauzanensis TaxID=658167 RepID=A0A1M5YKJ3_9BURK|nr:hypothetical protein SAMN04488135_109189 [Pollutimonas bauzanensis]